jgi:hypothetical protein
MSFDLGFFAHTPGMSEADVRDSYRAYCGGTRGDHAEENQLLAEFVRSLELRYPPLSALSDDEVDDSPWSSEFDCGPTHLIVSMAFSKAPEVGQYIWDLLQKFPLIVYDPQADEVFFGTERLPAVRPN